MSNQANHGWVEWQKNKTVEAYRYPVDVQIIVLLGLMFLTKETANPSLVQSAVVEYTCFLLSGFAVLYVPYCTNRIFHTESRKGVLRWQDLALCHSSFGRCVGLFG